MNISKSLVEKLMITGAKMPNGLGTLDPIAVMLEDFGPGAGKITITCFGQAWSNYWGHMGKTHTIRSFFLQASNDYLIGKLDSGIRDEIDDDDIEALKALLKQEIIKERRDNVWSKQVARDLWEAATWVDWETRHDTCAAILGDEWWCCTPKKPNPEYEYLGQIVTVVKEAIKMEKEAIKMEKEAA